MFPKRYKIEWQGGGALLLFGIISSRDKLNPFQNAPICRGFVYLLSCGKHTLHK